MLSKKIVGLSMAGILMGGTALADVSATASTDLNLRAGPGPNYAILDVIAANDAAVVEGCLAEANWCKVTYNGTAGWAYGDYLTAPINGEAQPLYPNRERIDVASVTYDTNDQAVAAATLGTIGATAGAMIVGGPAAIAVGALAGSVLGAATTPDEVTVTYALENPVEPVFVNGEVVIGAGIPETVTLYEVPGSEIKYVNLNGQYVFVGPEDRRIVHIER